MVSVYWCKPTNVSSCQLQQTRHSLVVYTFKIRSLISTCLCIFTLIDSTSNPARTKKKKCKIRTECICLFFFLLQSLCFWRWVGSGLMMFWPFKPLKLNSTRACLTCLWRRTSKQLSSLVSCRSSGWVCFCLQKDFVIILRLQVFFFHYICC